MPESNGHYPIIYVRGYAGSQSAVEDTAADPFMGFNVGATKIRQAWSGKIDRHYFESPLVRLMKEHQYEDVYADGRDLPEDRPIPPRPVVVYRYYDVSSRELGTGDRQTIEAQARGLGECILRLRDRMCGDDAAARAAFKVHLVAHSMGGLICRCFLQNRAIAAENDAARFAEARRAVDKVFTYATPHNGIDLAVIGNVPGFFTRNNAENFNRDRMRQYLGLPPSSDDDSVANLNGEFDPDRFFTLVGTNHRDYDVGMGLVREIVGPMSDGLVRIENATVCGPWPGNGAVKHSPRAFVHRAHSGHYGIVNSEEGYQNLVRFLFGNVRVDGVLEVNDITMPPELEKLHAENQTRLERGEEIKQIRASYHFEAIVRVRGAIWDLSRRTANEGSAVFRQYDELFHPNRVERESPRHPHLFSAFLSAARRVNTRRPSLGFSVDLGVLVPQYEVEGLLWFKDHYEGGYLYRDKINLEAIPDDDAPGGWRLRYGYDSRTPNRATMVAPAEERPNGLVFRVAVQQETKPGIDATLVLRASSC